MTGGAIPFAFNGNCGHVVVTGHYEGGCTPVRFASGPTYPGGHGFESASRTIGVKLDLTATRCWYGANFNFSGDHAEIRLVTEGVYRSYFPYGVKHHDVRVVSKAPLGADCLLKAYEGHGLEDIQLRYTNTETHTPANAKPASQGSPCIEIDWGDNELAGFRALWIDVDVRYNAAGDFGPVLRVVRHGVPARAVDRVKHKLHGLRFGGIIRGALTGQGVPIDLNAGGSTDLEEWSSVVLEDLRLSGVPAMTLDGRGVVDSITTRRVVTENPLTFTRSATASAALIPETTTPVGGEKYVLEVLSCT